MGLVSRSNRCPSPTAVLWNPLGCCIELLLQSASPPPSYGSRISPGGIGHLPHPGSGGLTGVGEASTGLRHPANTVSSEAVSRVHGVTFKPVPYTGHHCLSPLLPGPDHVPRSAPGTPAVTPRTRTRWGECKGLSTSENCLEVSLKGEHMPPRDPRSHS